MRLNKRLGYVVLSIWLIVTALVLFGIGLGGLGQVIWAILAVIAGALLLLGK